MKNIFFLIAALFLPVYSISVVTAGYITIKTETALTVDRTDLKVRVNVVNEGDESAFNVQINVNENQRTQSSPIKQILPVKENYDFEATCNLARSKHGRYPLTIHVDYTDANQYPFTALTVTQYSFGSDTVSRIFGSADNIRLTGQATLPLKLKNMDETSREVQVSLVVPKELSVQEKTRKVAIQPRSEVDSVFQLSNFSALPGSRYQAFFALEYEDDDRHYSSVVPCFIHVEVSEGFFKKYKWYIIAGSSVLFVILMIFQFVPKKRKNSGNQKQPC